jgi:hypothetical protein
MKNLLRKIFGLKQIKPDLPLEPPPPDWKFTISDLMKELQDGKRQEIREPELSWAREYERSLIPENYRFPKKGDLYESKKDQEVEFTTAWAAPYTGGGKSKLFKGEKVWIVSEINEKRPIGTYVLPVDYKELEERMVSQSDINAFNYNGFSLYFTTKDLNENFELVETGFSKERYS